MSTGYHLPDHAPSRIVRPGDSSSPPAAPDVHAQQAVDAINLDVAPKHR